MRGRASRKLLVTSSAPVLPKTRSTACTAKTTCSSRRPRQLVHARPERAVGVGEGAPRRRGGHRRRVDVDEDDVGWIRRHMEEAGVTHASYYGRWTNLP